MAYVPPHKRHTDGAAVVPESMSSRFEGQLTIGSRDTRHGRKNKKLSQGQKIFYAKSSISRWWPFGSVTEDPIPSSVCLEPFASRHAEGAAGEGPLVLVGGKVSADEVIEGVKNEPWVLITDKILPDLVAALENLSPELQSDASVFKPSLVARFGKILFHGGSSLGIDALRQAAHGVSDSRNKVHKSFYTNVPKDFFHYVENITSDIGVDFESSKEHYHIKILDKTQPDSTISCKCVILEDAKELEIYKVELNPVRYLVVDISCLYKELDLRVMLCNKKEVVDLNDEEKDCVNKLVKAAVIDHNVKGGLRWPLGKESAEDRFTVVSVWHTTYKSFKGATVRLKLRNADRFDFGSSSGEVATEISLKMKELSKILEEGVKEADPIRRMLESNIQMIWNHFMSFQHTNA